MFRRFSFLILLVSFVVLIGCSKNQQTHQNQSTSKAKAPIGQKLDVEKPMVKGSFYLSQAQFIYETDDQGNKKPVPGPARLEIISTQSGKVQSEVIEDSDSNVFHKTMTAEALGFPDRLLTIGANDAFLKLWRHENGSWISESLWNPVFGGKHNRLRDIEVGDVDGDDKPEIVIATHDQGVIAVLKGDGTKWNAQEFCRKEKTFVHEIEIGDVNGNGINEFYATPSAPNKMDGSPQPGKITCLEFKNGTYNELVVEEFPERHVKEILVAEIIPGNKPYLFAALEAEMIKGDTGEQMVDPVKIKQYVFSDNNYQGTIIAELDDRQCRFLSAGDVTNDGKIDLVAAGFKSGLWLLEQPKDTNETEQWQKTLIDGNSSGYEHATILYDIDSDGVPEIYVAADDQRSLKQYRWDGKKFEKTKIATIKDDTITFGLMATRNKL